MEKIKPRLILIFICLPIIVFTQQQQLKVDYSAEYKLPLLKRMLKSTLPKSFTVYYTKNANRVEFENDFNILGKNIKMSGNEVNNYALKKTNSSIKFLIENDQDTIEQKLDTLITDTSSIISYTSEEKIILDIKCIGFVMENDESKTEGFLTTEFSAIGAIIKGKDYGLPMYLKEYQKKEKITQTLKIISIQKEPIKESYYIINE